MWYLVRYMSITFRISERFVLIAGLVIIIFGFIAWMPFGPGYPDVEMTGKDLYIIVTYVLHNELILSISVSV